MSDNKGNEDEARQRIITHMNKDHQDSLVRFLEHYAHVSAYSARNAKLAQFKLDSLTITSSNGRSHVIPISAPLKSLSEARGRMVAMDQETLHGLKRSNVTVKGYIPPNSVLGIATFVSAGLTVFCFSRRSNFLPGSLLYDSILIYVPRFAQFCYDIQPYLFYAVVAIHICEASWMARTRLRMHSVPVLSGLWWKWVLSTFIDGVGSFMRLDKMVKQEADRKAKARH